MTLDCSAIPIVEFDDGSTVLLDFSDRIPKTLQRLIVANWKNFSVLKVRPSQNIFLILQETINASASYTMKKGIKPLLLEKEPQILLTLDWIISAKSPSENGPSFHGILVASDKTLLLPEQVRRYAEQKGISADGNPRWRDCPFSADGQIFSRPRDAVHCVGQPGWI